MARAGVERPVIVCPRQTCEPEAQAGQCMTGKARLQTDCVEIETEGALGDLEARRARLAAKADVRRER